MSDKFRWHLKQLQFYIENLSMPWEELREVIESELEIARETGNVRYMCYAGPYDILVQPNGTFQLIPATHLRRYQLDGDYYQDADQQ